MGWTGGTDVFDTVVGEVFQLTRLSEESVEDILHVLIDALEEQDWDTQNESQYWDTAVVQRVFKERNPEWFGDPDDE